MGAELKVRRSGVPKLKAVTSPTIRYHEMHQRIVVIDRSLTWFGSLNTLSHSSTHEVMVLHEGRQFAERLLQEEQAELFASPPRAHCEGAEIEPAPSTSKRQASPWDWRCAQPGCRWRQYLPPGEDRRSRPGQQAAQDAQRSSRPAQAAGPPR